MARMSVEERNSPGDLYEAQAQRLLAEHLVVAGVFVDAKFNLLFSRGEVHRYLDMAEGLPTVDLLSLAPQPLKARLRKNLREVFAKGGSLCARNIALSDNGQKRHVRVTVTRVDLKQRPEPCAFVVFEDEPPSLAPVAETEDMQNLLLSADIATLFLDEDCCVQRFTPKSEQLSFDRGDLSIMAQADRSALNRIVTNVIDNAVKFTKRDKLDSAVGGCGLGMAITKNLVDSMKGKLW